MAAVNYGFTFVSLPIALGISIALMTMYAREARGQRRGDKLSSYRSGLFGSLVIAVIVFVRAFVLKG